MVFMITKTCCQAAINLINNQWVCTSCGTKYDLWGNEIMKRAPTIELLSWFVVFFAVGVLVAETLKWILNK